MTNLLSELYAVGINDEVLNKHGQLFVLRVATLTEADAQDAGGSYFEHILLCTTSVAFGHWASLVSVSGTYGA